MLTYNEGVPRSGKSYDAVKEHILPALKRRRKVFARLNGMGVQSCREHIAKRVGLTMVELDELLIHVSTSEVKELFVAKQDESGQWQISDQFRNSLVVIDEVHEFYVGGTREPLAPAIEQFFALHGHYGIDVLVMTQFYKRIHTAIRYRIERKNVFQKLSALGSKGEKLYRQTFYQTIEPDKYEKVGGATHGYDETVFPCYHGIVDGGESGVTQEVYSSGRINVFRSMALRAALIVPAALFGVWFLYNFFSGGASDMVKPETKTNSAQVVSVGQVAPSSSVTPVAYQEKPRPPTAEEKREAIVKNMTPEQRYVWQLGDEARIRLVAVMTAGKPRGIVEWVNTSSVVKERLTLDQLRSLGIEVTVHEYGVQLRAGDQVTIATQWPLDVPLRDEQPRLYDTSQSGGVHAVSDSEPHAPAREPASTPGLITYTGSMVGRAPDNKQ